MTQIVITEAPASVDPADPTSFFPQLSDLVAWGKARHQVPNKSRPEITLGEPFAALVEIKQDSDGRICMIVANAPCGADMFTLSTLTDDDKVALTPLIGTMVAAALVVRERLGDHWCHGSHYIVDPGITLATLPFNPTMEQLRAMPLGTKFVVQGTFMSHFEVAAEKGKILRYITVNTPNGELTLQARTDELIYVDGVIENLRYKPVIVGETIRINGRITDKQDRYDYPLGVATVDYNQPYLLVPDPQRLTDYNNLRAAVEDVIDNSLHRYAVEQKWWHARQTFASLRQMELTKDESQMIIEIMESVPAEHRSIYCTSAIEAARLQETFGTNPEVLDRSGFLAYAREIFVGQKERPKDNVNAISQSSLFSFWAAKHSVLDEERLVEILLITIPIRLARLEHCSDNHRDYRDDLHVITDCLERIRYEKKRDVSPRLVRVVMDLIDDCFYKGYYQPAEGVERDQACPRRLDELLRTCFDTLASAWQYQPIVREMVTPQVVAEWSTRLSALGAEMSVIHNLRQRVPYR